MIPFEPIQIEPKDIRTLHPYSPTDREVRILIEHTYDKWEKAYGRCHGTLTPKGEKDQRYERRKHAIYVAMSPDYAHYVCIKATRYCKRS